MANELLNNEDLLQENLINPAMDAIEHMEGAAEKAIGGRDDLGADERDRLFEATKKSIELSAQYLAEALKTSKNALETVNKTTAAMKDVLKDDEFTDAQKLELTTLLKEETNKVFENYLKEQAERNKSFLGNVWQGIKKAVNDFGHKDNVEQELEEHTRRTGKEFLKDTYDKTKEFVHSALDKVATVAKDFAEKHAPDKDKPGLKEQLDNIAKGAKDFYSEHIQKAQEGLDSLVQNAKADLSQWKHDMTAGKVMQRYYSAMEGQAKADIIKAGLEAKWAALGVAVNKVISDINPDIRSGLEYAAINREEKMERAAVERAYAKGEITNKERIEKEDAIYQKAATAKRDVNDYEKTNLFERRASDAQTKQGEAERKLDAARARLASAESMRLKDKAAPDQNAKNYNRINHEKPILISDLRDTVQSVVEKKDANDIFRDVDKRLRQAAKDFSLIRGEKSLVQSFGKDELAEMNRMNREISKLSGEIKAEVATMGSMIDQNRMNGYVEKLNALCDRMEEVCHQNALTEPVKMNQIREYSETGVIHGNAVRSDATTVKNVLDSLNAPEYANTELITTSNGKVVDTYDRIPLADIHKNAQDFVKAVLPYETANALLSEVAKINNCQSAESKISNVELEVLTSSATSLTVFDIAVTSEKGETLHNLYKISDNQLEQFALVAQSGTDILRGVDIIAGRDAEHNLISDLSRQASGFTKEVLDASGYASKFVESLNRDIDLGKDDVEHDKDDRSDMDKL